MVLVTGAAGSIGSELCHQVLDHRPELLVAVDVNENALFELEHALVERGGAGRLQTVLGNVRDRARVNDVFATYAPSVVFHAAAYKHVPVLESFPEEASIVSVAFAMVVPFKHAFTKPGLSGPHTL